VSVHFLFSARLTSITRTDIPTGTGSAHDNQCCICHKPELLEPCHTCRLAFHPECLPHGWARNSYNQLFCSICVARGWDRSPPVLTPPASPQPSQAQLPAVNVTAPPSQHLPSQTPAPESRPEGLGGIPINQSPTHGAQVAELAGQNSTPTPGSHAANSDRIANTATPEPKRRQRKSRYSTLPSEVDLSLATIYRELESVASLRTEVEDLRNESAQQNQTIRIHEQNQIVMRRELEALRANATNSESVNKELSELRKRNASLEAELQVSREQTAAAKELKERLAQLLNN